jgi:transglutaminase-like putative cysteine protease
MKLKITKTSTYTYEEPVSFSPHNVRVFPRTDLFAKVVSVAFSSTPGSDIQYRRDLFDNIIAYCFYPEPSATLHFHLDMVVEVEERNPFHFLLDSNGLSIPPHYPPEESDIMAPYLAPASGCSLPQPLAPGASRPTVETLVNLNHWIHENISYENRPEGQPQTPRETLEKSSGSCRDMAALLSEALRQNGVAARLASGFVWEGDKSDSDKRAVSSMHLWVEACMPGAGWIGMDPTNGVLTNHHFIATAVGRRHSDVAPISGAYYSNTQVQSRMDSIVRVEKID